MSRWAIGLLSLAFAIGCTADLQRVHTPDLLKVSNAEAKKWRGSDEEIHSSAALPARSTWQLHTTLEPAAAILDDSPSSFAQAVLPASKDQYVLVDLGELVTIRQVIQDHADPDGYPRRYRIDVAGDHNFPYTLRYVGNGSPGQSVATFKQPVQCRFLRITVLEPSDVAWNISELWLR
jgi:hypothetical protein